MRIVDDYGIDKPSPRIKTVAMSKVFRYLTERQRCAECSGSRVTASMSRH